MTMKALPLGAFLLFLALTSCNAQNAADEPGSSPSHRRMSPEQEAMIAEARGIPTDIVAYRNVAVFAATAEDTLTERMTILVKYNYIADIVPSANDDEAIAEASEIIDGSGWYVVPGLIDSHVHLGTLPNRGLALIAARRYLYGGITAVRDMAGDSRSLAELARSSLLYEVAAPDIYYSALMAGPSFFSDPRTVMSALGEVAGEVPWMQGITADTDMSLAVAFARGTSATGIKIYANLGSESVRRIIDESERQRIPVWSHIEVYPATIFDTVGVDAVSHVCMIPLALMRPDGAAPRSAEAFSIDPNEFDINNPEFQRYVAELAAAGTAVDATAHMYRKTENRPPQPRLPKEGEEPLPTRPNCSFDRVVAPIVNELHKAGVPIIAGTDMGADPEDPFPALIQELETLADIDSMSNADVVRAATINAAHVLNLDDEFGTVEVGKYANLVFVAENPLENISNLRSIVLTVKRGQRYWRSDFEVEE